MNSLIICGATATGKSSLAYRLATLHNGDIINADSVQLYREFPILTAQPVSRETAVNHHLYAVQSCFTTNNTVVSWLNLAKKAIEQCLKNNQKPIIVGGTGLYIHALLYGISNIPAVPLSIRRGYESSLQRQETTLEQLYEELQRCDMELAAKISANDKQRIIRGLSVYKHTGVSITTWQKRQPIARQNSLYDILLVQPERPILHGNIAQRLQQMIAAGVIDEVAAELRNRPSDQPLPKIIGLNSIVDYIDGKLDFATMQQHILAQTRQYAKRQDTWFRNKIAGLPQVTVIGDAADYGDEGL